MCIKSCVLVNGCTCIITFWGCKCFSEDAISNYIQESFFVSLLVLLLGKLQCLWHFDCVYAYAGSKSTVAKSVASFFKIKKSEFS